MSDESLPTPQPSWSPFILTTQVVLRYHS